MSQGPLPMPVFRLIQKTFWTFLHNVQRKNRYFSCISILKTEKFPRRFSPHRFIYILFKFSVLNVQNRFFRFQFTNILLLSKNAKNWFAGRFFRNFEMSNIPLIQTNPQSKSGNLCFEEFWIESCSAFFDIFSYSNYSNWEKVVMNCILCNFIPLVENHNTFHFGLESIYNTE